MVLVMIAAILAVVSVSAAVVATRAVAQIRDLRQEPKAPALAEIDNLPAENGESLARPEPLEEAEYKVVQGRVIVQPTQAQVVAATMTRPSIRVGIFMSGLAHALRPESRDRIRALIKREYLGRKRARQRAAKAAARAQNAPPPGQGVVNQ